MKKLKSSNMFLSLCAFMIAAAPLVDMSTRSYWGFGESDYPEEKDYI